MGKPSVYPTGVTIFKSDATDSGYTLFRTETGIMLIDMNGNLVKCWKGLDGMPPKLLPGGSVIGYTKNRDKRYCYQDSEDLTQVDWDGNIQWRFIKNELISDPSDEPRYMARHHHDFQRDGSTVGYYYPGCAPKLDSGNTLILTHTNVRNRDISDKLLIDDRVIEVTWDGETVWEWKASDHFDEFGFDGNAKNAIYNNPQMEHFQDGVEDAGDWIHLNCVSPLGENKWYDAGDERFHPDNLIMGSRQANIVFIVSKATGEIVWKLGPDFSLSKELREIRQIIGQHHSHMIPRGLPGEGNILMFDNGGTAGYGIATSMSPDGQLTARRHYSRVLEIDPVAMKIVWQYPKAVPDTIVGNAFIGEFFSAITSSAQRLTNGNTLITEGIEGRIFEVTPKLEIVWEYIAPYTYVRNDGSIPKTCMLYRAYRYPYDWVPQLKRPVEKDVIPPKNNTYRVPGSESVTHSDAVMTEIKIN